MSNVTISDVEMTFQAFSVLDQKRILNRAFTKALEPMVEEARSQVSSHRKTGNLWFSVGTLNSKDIGVWIGARIRNGYKGYLGAIFEKGTKPRFYVTRNGVIHRTGEMRGYWFMENAKRRTEKQILSSVTGAWNKEVLKKMKRLK